MTRTQESWKRNLIAVVEDHRAKETADCNVSLYLLRHMAEAAGITFTDEEGKLFL